MFKILLAFIDYILQAILAIIILIVVFPIMIWIVWKIWCENTGSILFSQTRVGQHGKTFKIYKFRTMKSETKKQAPFICTTYDDPRITEFGRFLRRKKLDELPQLINVILGQMRFVGPRPEVPHFHEKNLREIPEWGERIKVKPGITGYAQIHPRISHDPKEKIIEDLRYVNKHGILVDLQLMFRTFWAWLGNRVL